jgi:hypothetical protein
MLPETIGQTKTNLVHLLAGDQKTMRYVEADRKSGRAGKGEWQGCARIGRKGITDATNRRELCDITVPPPLEMSPPPFGK